MLAGASMGAHTIAALRARPSRARRWRWSPSPLPSIPRAREATSSAGTRLSRRPAQGRRGGLRRGVRRAAGARGDARHRLTRHPPAPVGPRAPRRGRRRAARRCRARGRSTSLGRARRARPARSTVVASRDEADPGHPLRDRGALRGGDPRARGCSREEPGKSPLAWQGGQLSRVIAERGCTRALRRVTIAHAGSARRSREPDRDVRHHALPGRVACRSSGSPSSIRGSARR